MFSMSPFQLRRERFSEFCLLVSRINKLKGKDEQTQAEPQKKKNFIPVTDYKPIKKGGGVNG
jgi:hypothetical protein